MPGRAAVDAETRQEDRDVAGLEGVDRVHEPFPAHLLHAGQRMHERIGGAVAPDPVRNSRVRARAVLLHPFQVGVDGRIALPLWVVGVLDEAGAVELGQKALHSGRVYDILEDRGEYSDIRLDGTCWMATM